MTFRAIYTSDQRGFDWLNAEAKQRLRSKLGASLMPKTSPFLITDYAVNQLTMVAAYNQPVIDLVELWRDAKANLGEIETMLSAELDYYLNPVGPVVG